MVKIFTLCLLHQHPNILLGMKKRGFGKGRWNGFGGKCQENESIEQAAKREMEEEVGIKIKKMEKKGIFNFIFKENPEVLEIHVFNVNQFEGEPQESEEMKPKWFNIKKIPFEEMWAADKHWIPLFLEGKKFRGWFFYESPDSDNIINLKIREVEEI